MVLVPRKFKAYTEGMSKKSRKSGAGRRRRRRRNGESDIRIHTQGVTSTSPVSGSGVPTPLPAASQPETNWTSSYDGLVSGALGIATLGSTVAAAAIGAVSSAVGSAITGGESGILGGNSTSLTAGVSTTVATTNAPVGSSYYDYEFDLIIGASAAMSSMYCLFELCMDLLSGRVWDQLFGCVFGRAPAQNFPLAMRFVYYENTDSGYGSLNSLSNLSQSSVGSGEDYPLLGESMDKLSPLYEMGECPGVGVSSDSYSLKKWLEGDEGPSGLCSVSPDEGESSVVGSSSPGGGSATELCVASSGSNDGVSVSCDSDCSGLCEVVVTQPLGSEDDLTEVVVTQPLCGSRSSVREALGSVNGNSSDPNRGPGGKCKKKLKHLER